MDVGSAGLDEDESPRPNVTRVRAVAFMRALPTGATQPAVFRCADCGGEQQEYAVKFHGQLQSRILCELVAALLGRCLGLPIPSPAIVEVPSRLIATIPDPGIRGIATPGLNYGSLFVVGYRPWVPGEPIPSVLRSLAMEVFAFDMLIQNVDRTTGRRGGKPNLLWNGKEFLLIDHEKAFSFLNEIGPPSSPWELRRLRFARHHLFFRDLSRLAKQARLSFDAFLRRLEDVSDDVFVRIADLVPQQWRSHDNLHRMLLHVGKARDNIGLLKRGLLEALQ